MSEAVWMPRVAGFVAPYGATATGLTSSMYRLIARQAQPDPNLIAVHSAKSAMGKLLKLERNWDGLGSEKPREMAVSRTFTMLPWLIEIAERSGGWEVPHFSANENGEVTLEWWSDSRKLTVFIGVTSAEYLFSWGEHIENDMEDGALTEASFPRLWSRLFLR